MPRFSHALTFALLASALGGRGGAGSGTVGAGGAATPTSPGLATTPRGAVTHGGVTAGGGGAAGAGGLNSATPGSGTVPNPTAAVGQIGQSAATSRGSTGGAGGASGVTLGGGGGTINDCMALWDKDTHMSKSEWRRTCRRTLNGIEIR